MIFSFESEKWIKEGKGDFLITESFAEIRKNDKTLSRIKCTIPLSGDEKALEFSVKCETEGVKSNVSAYAVVSQINTDNNAIIRIYGENTDESGEEKHCVFNVREGCGQITVELGLKSEGLVRFYMPTLTICEPEEKRIVKVVTPKISGGVNKETQLKNICDVVDVIGKEKPDVIVLSETLNTMGTGISIIDGAETICGKYCSEMCQKAKLYNTYIVANFIEKDGEEFYNTSVLINRKGEIAGRYRKTHLSFAEYEAGVSPGEAHPVFKTDFGVIGMLICWDAYFPEPARVMALKGAELLLISTIGDPGFRHVSRALENGVYVAVGGTHFQNLNNKQIGTSKIVSPVGEILSEANEYGEYAICEINLSDKMSIPWLSFNANGIPNNVYMNERRPDLYNEL